MFLSDCTKSTGNHNVDINNKTIYTVNIYFSLKNITEKNHSSIEKPMCRFITVHKREKSSKIM